MSVWTDSEEILLPTPDGLTAYSPEWWLHRLERRLEYRRPVVDLYEDYFEGRHTLSFATSKFRETFAQLLAAVSDNWMPLVIDAPLERLIVQGISLGDGQTMQADDAAWRIWQENELDGDSRLLFTEASKHGEAYLMVWWGEDRDAVSGPLISRRSQPYAEITVEHPAQVIVEREPGNRRKRAAGLKKWRDANGEIYATLYLPDAIYKFQRYKEGWGNREGVASVEANPLGVVPIIPVVNNPSMLPSFPPKSLISRPHAMPEKAAVGLGRSDLADVISTQDQINKLLCDMMVASEVSAYRQRWATGLEIPFDETTGEPVQPFEHAVNRLWVSENPNTKFGEFDANDLSNYTGAIEHRIVSIGARTRTPPHYLLGSIVNASGDALKAAEAGLSNRVEEKQRSYSEAIEEAIRLAFAVEGDLERANSPMAEVDWKNAETRSESEYVDSLVKKMALGVPQQQLWADAGYSPQQIKAFRAMLREQALEMGLFDTVQGLPSELPAAVDSARPTPTDPEPAGQEVIEEGDVVVFEIDSGRYTGRVEHVMTDGVYGLEDSNYSVPGTPQNPALSIRILEETAAGWVETENTVGAQLSDVISNLDDVEIVDAES